MISNSLQKELLQPNQTLYLIRYSQKPNPVFVEVHYNGFNNTTKQFEYSFIKNDKKVIKKISLSRAKYRLFFNKNEMSRALFDCFIKRNIELVDEYKELFNISQEESPELWI